VLNEKKLSLGMDGTEMPLIDVLIVNMYTMEFYFTIERRGKYIKVTCCQQCILYATVLGPAYNINM
jgi:hypothetical protein